MDRVAATLQRDGAKPGDTIAICAYACNAYVVLFMGALRAGLAVAPLAPSSTPAQIAGMMADSGARHLFLDAANASAVPAALTGDVRRIRLDDSSGDRAGCVADAARQRAAAGDDRAPVGLQHHLFVGHDRHAQGHRAVARDALVADARAPRPAATGPAR